MEEIGKALVKLVESGSTLAPSVMSYWFAVRIIDALSGVVIAAVIMGGLWAIASAIVGCVDRYKQAPMKTRRRDHMRKKDQFRQGDVLLERVDHALSPEAKLRPRDHGRVVLAYGETTAHAHALDGALTELFEEKDGLLYLRVGAPDTLRSVGTHTMEDAGRHDPIELAPGLYRVADPAKAGHASQREYHPAEIRRVAD
jgi:hypothetical protein